VAIKVYGELTDFLLIAFPFCRLIQQVSDFKMKGEENEKV
jgi:hypothetical protein